jgi:predicted secreted protein
MICDLDRISLVPLAVSIVLTACAVFILTLSDFSTNVHRVFGANMTIIGQEDNGRKITVESGAVIEIHLKETGGTGYAWEMQDLDGKHFALQKMETKATGDERLSGSPVMRIWRLKALGTGDSRLRLYYFRPWEGKEKAAERLIVDVHITGKP